MTARCRARDEDGFLTPWLLGLCVALLFLGGLALDLWRVFGERRALANLADAAAIAGSSGLDEGAYRTSGAVRLDPARAEALAQANLAAQPPLASLVATDVAATPAGVTVAARGTVDFALLRLFLADDPFVVTVTATADPRGSP